MKLPVREPTRADRILNALCVVLTPIGLVAWPVFLVLLFSQLHLRISFG